MTYFGLVLTERNTPRQRNLHEVHTQQHKTNKGVFTESAHQIIQLHDGPGQESKYIRVMHANTQHQQTVFIGLYGSLVWFQKRKRSLTRIT